MTAQTTTKQAYAKLPPQDVEAERALLGSLMIDNSAIFEVAAMIQPDAIYDGKNRTIYKAMLDLGAQGEPLDVVTITAELRRQKQRGIDESFLVKIMNDNISSLHASSYARVVAEMSTRRKMIAAAQTIATMAWDEGKSLDGLADDAQGMLFEAIQQKTRRGLNHISIGMTDYMSDMELLFESPVEVSGMKTGYSDLDAKLNGLVSQRLYIVAGRPGMGKTALLLGLLDNMSIKQGKRGLVFSLEMSRQELLNRVIAKRLNIDTQRLARGKLNETELEKFYKESGRISQAPIFITDIPAMTPAQIRAECLKQDAQTGVDYVLIDYLQLMKVPGAQGRYEQVSTAARECKNLSKELDAPVVLASQLNRAVETRTEKRPVLSDLRDSGEIEEAADVVSFLYRDEYYNEDASQYPNQGEVNTAKNRHGPTGRVDLYWRAATASYHNLEGRSINL